jgi:lysozyme
MAMVRGIDVSAYQKDISWEAIKNAGLEFGFIKATEGTTYKNKHYPRHRRAAGRRGIPVGAYHFAHPDFDDGPEAEADHFLEAADPRPGDLLPVLDLERKGSSPTDTARWANRWLRHVEREIGHKPILYTYSAFASGLVGHEKRLTRYPLWLANYGKNNGRVNPVSTVGAWTSIAVHQYTSEGRIEGYEGPLDLNRIPKGSVLADLFLGEQASASKPKTGAQPKPEPVPEPAFGPPWRLTSRSKLLHEATRLDAAFLERVVEQAKAGGVATIRGTKKA